MPFIETNDKTTLFYNDWGSGKPVVLIHGWPLDSNMWEYQSVFLASQGLRVITYDRRGFGRSSQPWSGYDYDTMADDLKAVLDKLELNDVTLVGFSMGGGEVARYMSRHSGARVAKAVLVSAVTPYLLQTSDNPDGVDRSTFDQMVEGLQKDRPNFLATFGKKFLGAGLLNFTVTNEIQQWMLMMAMLGSPKATIDCVRAFSETDFRQDMAAFRIPTLVIHGDSDTTVPLEKSGKVAASMIPGAQLKVYDGAPHGLFFPEKDRLNQDLLAFIDG
jgi:non-heme chloroperoxidase